VCETVKFEAKVTFSAWNDNAPQQGYVPRWGYLPRLKLQCVLQQGNPHLRTFSELKIVPGADCKTWHIRRIVILARVNATDDNARHLLRNYPSGNLCFSTIITPTRATIYLEISHFRSNCATSFCSCLYRTATGTRSNVLNSVLVSITTYCIFKTCILKQTRSSKPISP